MLITSRKSPSVTMISGSVSSASTGLGNALAIPSTAAPMMYAHPPLIRTPSNRASASQRAAALIPQAIRTRMSNGIPRVYSRGGLFHLHGRPHRRADAHAVPRVDGDDRADQVA